MGDVNRFKALLYNGADFIIRAYKYISDKVKQMFGVPELKLLPGHLTLFFILSVIPILILTTYTATYFQLPAEDIMLFLQGFLPVSVAGFLVPTAEKGPELPIGVWMVTAFLIASKGMHAILVSSDTLYGFKHQRYLIRRLRALLLTIMLLIIVVFAMIAASSGLALIRYASVQGSQHFALSLFRLLKWPSILLFLLLTIKVVHIVTPRQRVPSRYTNIGALFTTFLWGAVTLLYTYYLRHFNNSYSDLFGDFANMVVLIMWMYSLAYVFVLGVAINAYCYKTGMKKSA